MVGGSASKESYPSMPVVPVLRHLKKPSQQSQLQSRIIRLI